MDVIDSGVTRTRNALKTYVFKTEVGREEVEVRATGPGAARHLAAKKFNARRRNLSDHVLAKELVEVSR